MQVCFQKHFSNDVLTSEGEEAGLSHSGNTQNSYSYYVVGTLASILCCSVFCHVLNPFFFLLRSLYSCLGEATRNDLIKVVDFIYLFIFDSKCPAFERHLGTFTPTAHLSWFNVGQPLFCIRAFCRRTCRIYLQNNLQDRWKSVECLFNTNNTVVTC